METFNTLNSRKTPRKKQTAESSRSSTPECENRPDFDVLTEKKDKSGIIAALGQLKPGAVITEDGICRLFGRSSSSVKRAIARGELPPPFRLFGSKSWTVGVLVQHFERLQERAAKEAERRSQKIARLSP